MTEDQLMREVMKQFDAEAHHPTLRQFVEHVVDVVVNHLYETEALESRVCPACETHGLVCPSCEPEAAQECEVCLALMTCSTCGAGNE